MSAVQTGPGSDADATEPVADVDVLIVGAGISGISSAVHLARALPRKSYLVLDKRDRIGGTWDLFRYPGVRSDSDMFTLGFDFKPWEHPRSIGDGSTIREYVASAAAQFGVESHIRFGHKVIAADWDSASARWTLTAQRADGETVAFRANFVHFASGYYSYERPYAPEFPGQERFTGTLVHPQLWPEDLDYTGQRVVVVGSGATAVTLTPAMADRAAHVTMLQRSPSYVIPIPAEDELANWLREHLPPHAAYKAIRTFNRGFTFALYQFFRHRPKESRRLINALQRRMLPDGYPVEVHFNPRYEVWDERLCIVPDGDLFKAISNGSAEIVTDTIETFTESGIRLASGRELEADIIISATGLNLELVGGAALSVDGRPVAMGDTVAYKGAMYSGLPNLAMTFGYVNASWTLKADLIATYITRLLAFMEERGYDEALPLEPPDRHREPFIDLQSGYVRRAIDNFPKQGGREPWRVHQNWGADHKLLARGPIADEGIAFRRRSQAGLARFASDAAPAPVPA